MFFLSFKSRRIQKNPSSRRGFTIVELIVTLGIFAVITGVVMAQYSDFTGGTVLTNLAYNIALTVRQAQVYGVAVKGASSDFSLKYGIHVENPTGNAVYLFADTNNNNRYTSGEAIEILTPLQGNTIDNFCAVRVTTGLVDCRDGSGSGVPITYLDVMYQRPNPDATITTSQAGQLYQYAEIIVRSPRSGTSKTIRMYPTGQISVK